MNLGLGSSRISTPVAVDLGQKCVLVLLAGGRRNRRGGGVCVWGGGVRLGVAYLLTAENVHVAVEVRLKTRRRGLGGGVVGWWEGEG